MNPEQKVDLLRAACCVACIDSEVTPDEQTLIDKLAHEVGCGKASVGAMIDRATRDPKFHEEQFRILKTDPRESMAALMEVAMVDGKITSGETKVLRALSQHLNVPTNVFDDLINRVTSMLDNGDT